MRATRSGGRIEELQIEKSVERLQREQRYQEERKEKEKRQRERKEAMRQANIANDPKPVKKKKDEETEKDDKTSKIKESNNQKTDKKEPRKKELKEKDLKDLSLMMARIEAIKQNQKIIAAREKEERQMKEKLEKEDRKQQTKVEDKKDEASEDEDNQSELNNQQKQQTKTAEGSEKTVEKSNKVQQKVQHEQKKIILPPLPKQPPQRPQIPVDQHFTRVSLVKVYTDQKGVCYSSTMNQTNVQSNINKFYIMQVLQTLQNSQYYVFTRWGRVGLVGQMAQAGPMKSEDAVRQYHLKKEQKMKHGYKTIQRNYQSKQCIVAIKRDPRKTNKVQVQSSLELRVQSLIRCLFDMKMVNSQLRQIGYDAQRMPLGKLAKASIVKGYQALKQLLQQLKIKKRKQQINRWSSEFYSHIPHDFGMKVVANYLLDTEVKVKIKLQMLQSLQDIQTFTKFLDQIEPQEGVNQLDKNYAKLNIEIKTVERDENTWKIIEKYVHQTHAPTHNQFKLEIDNIYAINQPHEFTQHLPNRFLLWHGSRITNFVGILSGGLKIAPPQAPATGYMFGKGVYFADVVSKSANYCFATKLNPTGCLLLCEVALGQPNQKFYADYYANLMPEGRHSTKGMGKSCPADGEMLGDIYVYNQYVVYDTNQIKIRYLVKFKFIFR